MKMIAGLLLAASLCSAQGLSNRRAPSWNLPDSNLKHYDLLDYRGKWLLLDFMITNCVHCTALSGTLDKVPAKYGDAKVAVLSVTVTPPETQATVAKYNKEHKLSIPILFDMGQVAAIYLKIGPDKPSFDTPHLFVIDPAGMIVRDWGYSDATKNIIEGNGLFAELDKLIPAKK
jgi:peroxiredoxin